MRRFLFFLSLIVIALLFSWLTRSVSGLANIFTEIPTGLYLVVGLLFAIGYGLNYVAPKTAIPSFVWAIFFGMALQPVFVLLTQRVENLQVVVELLAALVLFGGGVEVPFRNFKKFFGPIAALSLVGTLATVFIFAVVLELLGSLFNLDIPSIAFLLMGAVLASIDPTAIIPSLKMLRFKKPYLRDIAISESAVNDVVGTILTRFILVTVITLAGGVTVIELFRPILARETFDALALEIIWGVLVGLVGAWILKKWSRAMEQRHQPRKSDPALFFAIPIFSFAVGSLIGGSGFLAAFVAGLLFEASAHTQAVRHFFETFIDGFIKPVIFILLGAVVSIKILLSTVAIGILAAFIFMFIIRPLVVLISLAPWAFRKPSTFSWRELIFLSFIRETGAIPAVLILVVVASGVVASQYIFAIGMWVILLSLIIEPPLTPKLAEKLGIASPKL